MLNSQKNALISLAVSLVSFLAIFIPYIFSFGGTNAGIAISSVSFAIFLIAIICAPVYWWMSSKEKDIRQGKCLASWTYTDDGWKNFVNMEKTLDASYKKTIFLILIGVATLCSAAFFIMDPENGIYVIYAMLGLVGFMGLVALLTTYSAKRRLSHKGEVFISKDGVMINGQFHIWSIFGSRFEKATLHQETSPQYIEFEYSYTARYGRQSTLVRVPVPKENESDVPQIINRIQS